MRTPVKIQHTPAADHPGCDCPPRAGISRRSVLRGGLLAGLVGATAGIVGPDLFARSSFAAEGAAYTGDVVVVLSLRGGFDGLGVVAPVNDAGYQAARPNIRITPAQALQLDGTFGLHPAMAPLLPLYRSGALGFVHDVGQASPSRSHFVAMEELERAAPGSSLRTGWLDRALGARPAGTVFQAAQVGSMSVSPGLAGPNPEMSMTDVDGVKINAGWNAAEGVKWDRALRGLSALARPEVSAPAYSALGAIGVTAPLRASTYTPANGATYPVQADGTTTALGSSLRDVARLVKAGVGLQVACVDWGDWDMHVDAGRPGTGWMQGKLAELAAALAAFSTDLGTAMSGVTVVTLSEFGRRVAENGSGGTDHGHGNLVMMMGGGAVGGKVHGTWRGTGSGVLTDGDLPGSADYRLVLGELLEKRTGTTAASVFPGLSGSFLGVARAR